MKIALTGGSGGIGRAIAALALERGHDVVSIDRVAPEQARQDAHIDFVEADAADYDALLAAFAGCDALVHMAAIPSANIMPDHTTHNNNVTGSYNAMRAAIEVGIKRICQASSVNAIGLAFSRNPRFDYFPVDERHANYCEEPYSLSKWICEQQADSFARRYGDIGVASMRFHWVIPDRDMAVRNYTLEGEGGRKQLWAYTLRRAAADACLLSLAAPLTGHEAFYITAPDTCLDVPTREVAGRFYPDVPIHGALAGYESFFTAAKAERILGWKHPPAPERPAA
jgi:nucleoside-diphosphate-sugar epimerase